MRRRGIIQGVCAFQVLFTASPTMATKWTITKTEDVGNHTEQKQLMMAVLAVSGHADNTEPLEW